MRRIRVLAVLAGAVAMGGAVLVTVPGAAASWAVSAGMAVPAASQGDNRTSAVLGPDLVNGGANLLSVSCASAGSCAAGGFYTVGSGPNQGFVASERNGVWGRAIEVPGLAALNTGRDAEVLSVSCGSAGDCAAGGFYRGSRGHLQGFVVSERNGVWGRAFRPAGLGTLNTGGAAEVRSVSCGSAGNCAAGGLYRDSRNHVQGMMVTERSGVWGQAFEVPGLGALNAGGGAEVRSVSCTSAVNCVAGGDYTDSGRGMQGFVVSERSGRWRQAFEVPGLGALNTGGNAGLDSVSCGSAGNCAASGLYSTNRVQGFVVSELHGVWHQAVEVPGLGALNTGGAAEASTVSCGSAGNCVASGFYSNPLGFKRGFVVNERSGVWHRAFEVPGLAALKTGESADVGSLSCGSAGNCVVGGYYQTRSALVPGFVASERHGVWGRAIEVPGLTALNTDVNALVNSVSCASAGNCAVGGFYGSRSRHTQGFVVSQRHGTWGRAIELPGLSALEGGQSRRG